MVTPSLGSGGSPGLADRSVLGGPGVVLPQTLGQSAGMANIPPPGVVTAGLGTKPLAKGL